MYALGAIQLWMPMFSADSNGDHVGEFWHRSAWTGVQTIWMMPKEMVNLEGEVWWGAGKDQLYNLAVPADSFDRIDVFHVGPNGFIFNINRQNYFPSGCIEPDILSRQWRCCNECPTPESQMTYKTEIPKLNSGMSGEIEKPAMEKFSLSAKLSGKDILEGLHTIQNLTSPQFPDPIPVEHFPVRKIPTRWNELGRLFPNGLSARSVSEMARMNSLAEISMEDPTLAMSKITQRYTQFELESDTTFEYKHIFPAVMELVLGEPGIGKTDDFSKKVVEKVDRYADLTLKTKLKYPPSVRLEAADHPVKIDRVWGPLGLLWLILRKRIATGKRYRRCQNESCVNFVEGTASKKYCEDYECMKQRDSARQRRSRERRNINTG